MRSRRPSIRSGIAVALALVLAGSLLIPMLSFAETPDIGDTFATAKQVTWSYEGTASVDPSATPADTEDLYKVWLTAGKRFEAGIDGATTGVDVDVALFSSTATAGSNPLTYSASDGSDEYFYYDIPTSGWYYVDVWAYDGSDPGFPVASTAGDYYLWFWQSAVPYKLQSFTVPKTAKSRKSFTVSVLTSPTYLRTSKSVTFVTQKKVGTKWKSVIKCSVRGYKISGGKSKFSAKGKFSKGTYRIRAEFKDVDHKLIKTVWKTIKIK
jgi:hypothetical protein